MGNSSPIPSIQGGDEPIGSPIGDFPSLLVSDNTGTKTKRLQTDVNGNLLTSINGNVTVIFTRVLSRSDTYTSIGTGIAIDFSSFGAISYFINVKGSGSPAISWNVVLEGSADNINFTPFLTHTNTIGDNIALVSGANLYPALYIRSRVVSLSLGSATNIVVTILGKG